MGMTASPQRTQTIVGPASPGGIMQMPPEVEFGPAADVLPFHLPESIIAHPRFPAARAAYVEAMLAIYGDPFINRLLTEAGRSVTFFSVLALHASWDEADRTTWPTPRLLRKEILAYGVAGERRVADMVDRLVVAGYVVKATVPEDRRVRILVPTREMIEHDLDWLAAHFAPLDIMFPDPGYLLPMRRDPGYRKAHRRVGRRMSSNAARLMADNLPIMFFLGRDAGMMILIELVQRQLAGRAGPSLCFSDMGSRLGVSRTHVRNTLQEADRAGLVRLSGREAFLLPSIFAAFDRFVADCMSAHDVMFRVVTEKRPAPMGQ